MHKKDIVNHFSIWKGHVDMLTCIFVKLSRHIASDMISYLKDKDE